MRQDSVATRARIVATAERLYAERGVEAVSLVEVSRAAGQRNRSAAQYHFGDKAGLIDAILEKHAPGIEVARHRMLDALETRETDVSLRELVEALVAPVAAKLDDPDGGVAFLRIQAQLLSVPGVDLAARAKTNRGAERLSRWIARIAPIPTGLLQPRMVIVAGLLFRGLVELTHREEAQAPEARALFVAALVDAIEAVLAAPPSSATRALLANRTDIA